MVGGTNKEMVCEGSILEESRGKLLHLVKASVRQGGK